MPVELISTFATLSNSVQVLYNEEIIGWAYSLTMTVEYCGRYEDVHGELEGLILFDENFDIEHFVKERFRGTSVDNKFHFMFGWKENHKKYITHVCNAILTGYSHSNSLRVSWVADNVYREEFLTENEKIIKDIIE